MQQWVTNTVPSIIQQGLLQTLTLNDTELDHEVMMMVTWLHMDDIYS